MEFLFFFLLVGLQVLLTGGVLAVSFIVLREVRAAAQHQVVNEAILRELSGSLVQAVLGREEGKERELRQLAMIEKFTERVADIADPRRPLPQQDPSTRAMLEMLAEQREEAQAEMERLAALQDPDPDLRPKDQALTRGFMTRLESRARRTPPPPADAVEMPMPSSMDAPTGSEG